MQVTDNSYTDELEVHASSAICDHQMKVKISTVILSDTDYVMNKFLKKQLFVLKTH